MLLSQVNITGLGCYRNLVTIPTYSLTIIIGENDSGKSTIVKALNLLLKNSSAMPNSGNLILSSAGGRRGEFLTV